MQMEGNFTMVHTRRLSTVLHLRISSCLYDDPISVKSSFAQHQHLGRLGSLEQTLQVNRLWPLDGQAKRTVPDELCKRAETSTDTKDGGVVQRLLEAVMVE